MSTTIHIARRRQGASDLADQLAGSNGAYLEELLSSILQKDLRIASNTANLCQSALSDEQRLQQQARRAAASADLRTATVR